MEKIIMDRNLDGLALSDLNTELHEVMGLRPCLYPEAFSVRQGSWQCRVILAVQPGCIYLIN